MADWRPAASLEMLRLRAQLLQRTRAFFAERDVLEVETPVLSRAAPSDPAMESFVTRDGGQAPRYLHTSPEFAMKRLLASGTGAIFQLARVFRRGEAGSRHNPEFSLLEWYRPGFDHHQLMAEVDALVRELLAQHLLLGPAQQISYQEAFQRHAQLDPLAASLPQLKAAITAHGIDITGLGDDDRDAWLDLLFSHVVEARLPRDCPVFVYDYPASQAALARLSEENPAVAQRFELFINGMELANGFHELTDAQQQRQRFEHELRIRARRGLSAGPLDQHLLDALQAGLPDCAGVALGFDRLLMLAGGQSAIGSVLAFDHRRA